MSPPSLTLHSFHTPLSAFIQPANTKHGPAVAAKLTVTPVNPWRTKFDAMSKPCKRQQNSQGIFCQMSRYGLNQGKKTISNTSYFAHFLYSFTTLFPMGRLFLNFTTNEAFCFIQSTCSECSADAYLKKFNNGKSFTLSYTFSAFCFTPKQTKYT